MRRKFTDTFGVYVSLTLSSSRLISSLYSSEATASSDRTHRAAYRDVDFQTTHGGFRALPPFDVLAFETVHDLLLRLLIDLRLQSENR